MELIVPIEQYELLATNMANCKGKVMLSINDHSKIREIFKDFRIETAAIKYSIGSDTSSKSKKSKELIIMNYWWFEGSLKGVLFYYLL